VTAARPLSLVIYLSGQNNIPTTAEKFSLLSLSLQLPNTILIFNFNMTTTTGTTTTAQWFGMCLFEGQMVIEGGIF